MWLHKILTVVWCLAAGALHANERPNVILIVVDDLGWKDLGVQGSRFYDTPNIDQLAKEGVRFTDYYAPSPVCSASRAAMLTGLSPARIGITNITQIKPKPKPTQLVVEPPRPTALPLEEITIAEMLARNGYISAAIGKWHLGDDPYNPYNQGFAISIAGRNDGSDYFDPYTGSLARELKPRRASEYLTDRLTDEAVAFIERHRYQPFFLYLAHFAVHEPIAAPENLVELFRERVTSADAQHNPVYAGAIKAIDNGVGAILSALERANIQNRTLILLTSDNGGMLQGLSGSKDKLTSNAPLRSGKATLYEGGIRVPLIARWSGRIPGGQVVSYPAIGMDLMPTIAALTETPLPESVNIDGLDLSPIMLMNSEPMAPMPTIASPTETLLPNLGSTGLDLWPVVLTKSYNMPPIRTLFWHFPHYAYTSPVSAVRSGPWKLIEYLDTGVIELYDVVNDIGEDLNLANQRPEISAQLKDILYLKRKGVEAKMPAPNPGFLDSKN